MIAERLNHVYFLTNKNSSNGDTKAEGRNINGWSTCLYSETALGDEYSITCDTAPLNPVTREFSVTTDGGRSVALRELEIYGFGKLIFIVIH